MSHFNERVKKNCLNCNAEVQGKFCHICGQENVEPAETFWQLVTHFFHDLTHFDGKFFSTLRLLIFKPGFLSNEYRIGRRSSYLNPVKMYIFTSAAFFFIFFSFFKIDENAKGFRTQNSFEDSAANTMDSVEYSRNTRGINNGILMTRKEYSTGEDSVKDKRGIHFTGRNYKSRAEYDSFLKTGVKKHNWLKRRIIYKEIEVNEKFQNDTAKFSAAFVSNLIHTIPQMLFLSLPLFALFLKWIYIRHKKFYYASHMIFTFHLYIFAFIVMLFIFGITQLKNVMTVSWFNTIIGFLYLFIFFYEYKAMRNFYGQRRAKTIIKFILLNGWLFVIITILFVIFLFFSFLKV